MPSHKHFLPVPQLPLSVLMAMLLIILATHSRCDDTHLPYDHFGKHFHCCRNTLTRAWIHAILSHFWFVFLAPGWIHRLLHINLV
jgi:hypothetical protein